MAWSPCIGFTVWIKQKHTVPKDMWSFWLYFSQTVHRIEIIGLQWIECEQKCLIFDEHPLNAYNNYLISFHCILVTMHSTYRSQIDKHFPNRFPQFIRFIWKQTFYCVIGLPCRLSSITLIPFLFGCHLFNFITFPDRLFSLLISLQEACACQMTNKPN